MNEAAYEAIRGGKSAWARIDRGYIRTQGRDRLSYLQGQLSNDVATLQPGETMRACLLNNTGRLLAELHVTELGEGALVETDAESVAIVIGALERFVIRERVTFENASADLATITIQGPEVGVEFGSTRIRRTRTAAGGFDYVGSQDDIEALARQLAETADVPMLDDHTLDVLRVEAQIPEWGRELDESVIPLEAEMLDAISFTKGCYVGQEIIARIHSRGHVNRALRLIRLAAPVSAGVEIFGCGGSRDGEAIGRVTSSVVSPALGPIAMGYVRSEYAAAGSQVRADGAAGVVESRPE